MTRKDNGPPDDRAGRMMREAAEAAHSRILDDPNLPEQPSALRHGLYFAVVLLIAIVLNVGALVLVAR
jgi:hypothetical protein